MRLSEPSISVAVSIVCDRFRGVVRSQLEVNNPRGSLSSPLSFLRTCHLNFSFGGSRGLRNEVAQSKAWPTRACHGQQRLGDGHGQVVRLPSSGNHLSRNSSNDSTFPASSTAACFSHRHRPSSTKVVSRFVSLRCSQARISPTFVSTKRARRQFSFDSTDGYLVSKLVNEPSSCRASGRITGAVCRLLHRSWKGNSTSAMVRAARHSLFRTGIRTELEESKCHCSN